MLFTWGCADYRHHSVPLDSVLLKFSVGQKIITNIIGFTVAASDVLWIFLWGKPSKHLFNKRQCSPSVWELISVSCWGVSLLYSFYSTCSPVCVNVLLPLCSWDHTVFSTIWYYEDHCFYIDNEWLAWSLYFYICGRVWTDSLHHVSLDVSKIIFAKHLNKVIVHWLRLKWLYKSNIIVGVVQCLCHVSVQSPVTVNRKESQALNKDELKTAAGQRVNHCKE